MFLSATGHLYVGVGSERSYVPLFPPTYRTRISYIDATMDVPSDNEEWYNYIETLKKKIPAVCRELPRPLPCSVNRAIDHTLLSETATEEQIDTLCDEARTHRFAAVCVRLKHVARARQNLKECNDISVACVIGFPDGTSETADKVKEAQEAIRLGANELDMVMKYWLLKDARYMDIHHDITAVRDVAPGEVKLKVIIETSQMDRDEIIAGSLIVAMSGADFVKTSTGFKGPGATVENVRLMRAVVDLTDKDSKVKASGGIRSVEDCIKMLRAGADRIGTSSGVKIMEQLDQGEMMEQGVGHSVY